MQPNESPASVPIQPYPSVVKVAAERHADGWSTSIARRWPDGQGRHCRLCPRDACALGDGDMCLVVAPELVADDDAPLFSLVPPDVGPGLRVNRPAD